MSRYMLIMRSTPEAEKAMAEQNIDFNEIIEAMGRYNEELIKAGVMLAGEGLHPSAKGAKVRFEGGKRTVTDGPFTEAKELIGGYWIWECASRDEAIEWIKRAPFPDGTEIQLRQVFEDEDFDDVMTPELREAQSRLREQTETR